MAITTNGKCSYMNSIFNNIAKKIVIKKVAISKNVKGFILKEFN